MYKMLYHIIDAAFSIKIYIYFVINVIIISGIIGGII